MKRADEWYGADTMGTDVDHLIPSPGDRQANSLMYAAGTSTSVPSHWNNSPFLSGGRLTSAFGANPRGQRRLIMSYDEFLESRVNSSLNPVEEAISVSLAREYANIKRNPEIEKHLDSILAKIEQLPGAMSSRRGDRVSVKFESKEAVFDPKQDSLSVEFRNFYPVLKRYTIEANEYSQREEFNKFKMPEVDQIIYGQPNDAYGRTTKMSKFVTAVVTQSDVKGFIPKLEPHVETDAKGKRVLVGSNGSRPWDDVLAQIKQDAKKKIDDILKLYDSIPEVQRARENKTKTYYIVFSKHSYDIAGMSTNRGWTSCMNLYSGINKRYLQYDVENGTIVAYLVANNDLNIERPIARVSIKPFVNTKDEQDVLYEPEEKVYGSPPHTFLETVNKIMNEVQPGKVGRFKMLDTLYCDSKRNLTKYSTANIEQAVANLIRRKQVATTTDEVYYILDNYATYSDRGVTLDFSDTDRLYVDAPYAEVWFKSNEQENKEFTYCPIQFKRIYFLRFNGLTSFDNFPEQCNTLVLSEPKISDFTGCPTDIQKLNLLGVDIESFTGLKSLQVLEINESRDQISNIKSFNGLPRNITEIKCNSRVTIDLELQELIQQLKPLNLEKLSLTPLIINARSSGKLKTSFEAAVEKTLSTLNNPTSQTMGVAAYYMTLQQILNELPSLREICNIHRDDIQNRIDALLK